MSDVAVRVAVAATLLWLGMVAAISFLEAPLKFRAPGLDLRVGLAIRRVVFRALNIAEVIWAILIAVCLIIDPQSVTITILASLTGGLLVIQLAAVRYSERVAPPGRTSAAPASHWAASSRNAGRATSNSPPPAGSTGTTSGACTVASATSRPLSTSKPTTRPSTESRNPYESGREPGALHNDTNVA